MAEFESFDNSINKLSKVWQRSQKNENKLKEIPNITLDFNSINFNKKIITIPIVTNQLFNDTVQTILLKNFPEWAINMIEVHCVYTMADGFAQSPIIDDFDTAFDNGTLRVGDISITAQDFEYWFNNIDQTNYHLKIFLSTFVKQVSEIRPPGFLPPFLSNIVPMFVTLSLKIVNKRTYEVTNEKNE